MSDYTSTFDYLDSKMDDLGGNQDFYEDIFDNEGKDPIEEPAERKDFSWSKKYKMKHRPCAGCPDCRHWVNFECTNPAPKPEICDWISDRFREKGE